MMQTKVAQVISRWLAQADGESMRASPQLRLSLKKTDLRRAGSRSNQVSPLPTEQLDLRIGDAVSTPPATSKAHRRPQFLRQMTTGTSRKLHDREAVPTKKLFRNATTHFDESVQQRPDETEQVSEDSSTVAPKMFRSIYFLHLFGFLCLGYFGKDQDTLSL